MKRRVLSLLLALALFATLLPQAVMSGFADGCDPDVPTTVRTIPTSALPALLAQDDGHILIDVMPYDNYETQHIPGAISLPFTEFSSATEPLEALPDLDQIIYIFCGSGGLTKQAANKLLELGYTNLYNVGGWKQWATLGLPIADGPEPYGHAWETPIYTWTDDYYRCTATTTCKNDPEHKKSEWCYTLSQVTKQPTGTEEGSVTHTAYFTGLYSAYYLQDVFTTQTRTVALPKLEATDLCYAGHDWDAPTYVWAEDSSKVTATRLCKTNIEHYEAETVETVVEVIKEATATTDGEIRYTATFRNKAFAAQSRTVTIPKLGWGAKSIDWNELAAVWAGDDSQPEAAVSTRDAAPTGKILPTSALPALLEKDDGHILIDVLGDESYEAQHIPSAVSVPFAKISTYSSGPNPELPDLDQIIYVYCGSGGLTKQATTKLLSLGYKNVYNVGGWKQWATLGLSLAEGPETCGHEWEEPTYTWSDDAYTCTASIVCAADPEHTKSEWCYTLSQVTKQATATSEGAVNWTAYFTGSYTAYYLRNVFTTQVKTVSMPKLDAEDACYAGHDWDEPTYVWSADHSKVTATRLCLINVEHYEAETVESTAEVIKEATTEEPGEIRYTATFRNRAFADQTETVTVPKIGYEPDGHKWGEPSYEWAEDNSSCTATCVCQYDPEHILTETATALCETTLQPTGEAEGETTYTAFFKNELFETQTKKIAIPTLDPTDLCAEGHDWNEPSFAWAEDNSQVTATRICKTNKSHVETETVKTASEVTKEATVEEEGEITYTAVFTNPAFGTQTKKIAIPQLEPPFMGFDDVSDDAYYAAPVDWAVENEITNGMGDNKFMPERTCTRGQVVTFLWRAKGKPAASSSSNPFPDVKKGDYYYEAVLWAVENKITNGMGNGKFEPGRGCTRGQVVTFLWRAEGSPKVSKDAIEMRYGSVKMSNLPALLNKADGHILVDVRTANEYKGGHIPTAVNIPSGRFTNAVTQVSGLPDYNQIIYLYCNSGGRALSCARTLDELGYKKVYYCGSIKSWTGDLVTGSQPGGTQPVTPTPVEPDCEFSDVKKTDYFFEAVLWAVDQGITNGMGNGKFRPNYSCTRGQIVTFLYRDLAEFSCGDE